MPRGKEGKARRKEQRKEANKVVEDMLGGTHEFGDDGDNDGSDDDDDDGPPVVETVNENDDDDDAVIIPPPRSRKSGSGGVGKKKGETKYTGKAMKAAGAAGGSKGIRGTPLILLLMLVGTTLLPALIYASDFLGAYFSKNDVLGSIGYNLGIGQTPKKRVLSFYEKHDPEKIPDVPKILSKYYGKYPKLIKNLERKYQDYGYFLEWEKDEAPMTLAFEQLADTREYMIDQFNTHAPQPIKTGVRNASFNIGKLSKKFKKVWKKTLWPMFLEPLFGVPKGADAQKRRDAKEARDRKADARGQRRKNTEYRDDVEEEM